MDTKATLVTWPLKRLSGAHTQRHAVDMQLHAPPGNWSGADSIPGINAEVSVKAHNLGRAVVLGYTLSHSGYIGLIVEFEVPPAWYLQQNNNRNPPGLVFPSDLSQATQTEVDEAERLISGGDA